MSVEPGSPVDDDQEAPRAEEGDRRPGVRGRVTSAAWRAQAQGRDAHGAGGADVSKRASRSSGSIASCDDSIDTTRPVSWIVAGKIVPREIRRSYCEGHETEIDSDHHAQREEDIKHAFRAVEAAFPPAATGETSTRAALRQHGRRDWFGESPGSA